MRKPNSNCKLLSLDEAHQAQIADWLLNGMPYHQARAAVEKEFGIQVSLGAFSRFWSEVCAPAYIARRARAVGMAEEVAAEVSKSPGRFDAATVDAIKQKAFELAISPASEPKEVKNLFMLLQKSRDQEIKSEQLRLARDRFEFDAAKAALAEVERLREIRSDNALDEDGKLQAVREALFGCLRTATVKT